MSSLKSLAWAIGSIVSLCACGPGVSDYTSRLGEGYSINRVSPLDIYIQKAGILTFEGLVVDQKKNNGLVYGIFIPGKQMSCSSPQGAYTVMLYEDRTAFFVLNLKNGDLKTFENADGLDFLLAKLATGESSENLKSEQGLVYRNEIKLAKRGTEWSNTRSECTPLRRNKKS